MKWYFSWTWCVPPDPAHSRTLLSVPTTRRVKKAVRCSYQGLKWLFVSDSGLPTDPCTPPMHYRHPEATGIPIVCTTRIFFVSKLYSSAFERTARSNLISIVHIIPVEEE